MKTINWKLLLKLSTIGFVLAVGTVFWINANIESILWFIVFPFSAFIIAKNVKERFFIHGFILGLLNSLWNTLVHIVFLNSYLSTHPEEANYLSHSTTSPVQLMFINGLIVGVALGVIFGLFAVALNRILKKAETNKKRREEQIEGRL